MGLDYIIYNGNESFYLFVGHNSFKPFTYGIHPEDLEEFTEGCETLGTGESKTLVIRYRGEDEENYQLFEVTITHSMLTTGEVLGYYVQLFNLLSIKNIYERNNKNVRKYRTYMSMISVYYYEYDMNRNVFKVFIYVNAKSYLLVNEDFDKWYEFAVKKHVASDKDKLSLERFKKLLKGGQADFTTHISGSFFSKDATAEELVCTGKTVSIRGVDNVFGIMRNAEGYIDRNLAYYFTEAGKDSATGLLNKRAAKEFSKDLLSGGSAEKRYMLIIDIDDFKNFNDTYGHIFGDDVILKVSRVLSNCVNIRGIVGRIGGDEFYVLTEHIDTENDLRVLLKTISKNLFYAYENEKAGVHISTSIGVSCYPEDGTNYETLFKKADKALYIAKEKGKSRFIIYDEAKHGAVSEEEQETVEKHKPTLKTELCAGEVADLIVKLNTDGAAAVDEAIELARHIFHIERVQIVAANGDILYSAGGNKPETEKFLLAQSTEYLRLFNEFSIYMENNVPQIERYSEVVCKALTDRGIISFLHIAYPSAAAPKAFIFFEDLKVKRKWSEENKNFLMILSKVLLEVVCKYKGL